MRKKYGRAVNHLSDMFDVIKEENEFEHIEINVGDISYQSLIYDENYIELINQFVQKNEVTLSVHSCTDLNFGERVGKKVVDRKWKTELQSLAKPRVKCALFPLSISENQ